MTAAHVTALAVLGVLEQSCAASARMVTDESDPAAVWRAIDGNAANVVSMVRACNEEE